jgi:hypothetical protein
MNSGGSSERAVIYVESGGSGLVGPDEISSSGTGNSVAVATSTSPGGSNYIIKIQIGEESMFNPVRIDVSAGGKVSTNRKSSTSSISSSPKCQESPLLSSSGSEIEDQSSTCSGQSSPRSDMTLLTPPPRINAGGANRFGSETSESDTESDISAEFRPLPCQAAQFAMREICQAEDEKVSSCPPPPLRGIMKKGGSKTNSNRPPPLPSSTHPLLTEAGKLPGAKLVARIEGPDNTGVVGKMLSLSNSGCKSILVDQREFHVNEIYGMGVNKTVVEPEESLSNFAGYKDIFSRSTRDGTTRQILSDRGTIRGVKNRVRDGIATFLQSKDTKVSKNLMRSFTRKGVTCIDEIGGVFTISAIDLEQGNDAGDMCLLEKNGHIAILLINIDIILISQPSVVEISLSKSNAFSLLSTV